MLICSKTIFLTIYYTNNDVCASVRLKLNISVTTEPIGLYSSWNIPTGPVMVLSYFPWGWDTPNPPKN